MAEIKKYLDLDGLKLYDGKIKALIEAAGNQEANIKAIIGDLVGTLPEGATEKTIKEYLEAKITALSDKVGDVSTVTNDTVTSLAAAVAAEITRATNAENALSGRVTTLEGDNTTAKADIAQLKKDVESLEAGDGGELANKVTTLIGTDTGKSVRTIANEELAAQLIPENAKESLNTLEEIAAWIQAHPDDAAAMNASIKALQDDLGVASKPAEGDTAAVAATGLHKDVEDLAKSVSNTDAKIGEFTAITDAEITGLFTA